MSTTISRRYFLSANLAAGVLPALPGRMTPFKENTK